MFSKKTNQILISMLHKPSVKRDCFDQQTLTQLFNKNLIWYTEPEHTCVDVSLTDAGKGYVEALAKEQFDSLHTKIHMWTNTVIALAGVIIALFSLLKQ